MDPVPTRRARVSRETRLLITAALLAVVALWVLARLRFPASTTTQQVVAPLLAPLTPKLGFADLADQLADVSARANPSLLTLKLAPGIDAGEENARDRYVPVLRLRDDIGVVLLARGDRPDPQGPLAIVARDLLTGLAVVRGARGPSAPVASAWLRRDGAGPRFVLRTEAFADFIGFLPGLVGGMTPHDAPLWSAPVWEAGRGAGIVPGSFMFTLDGEWIGLGVWHRAAPAIAPADLVTRMAERLLTRAVAPPSGLGIDVQAITPALANVSGSATGAIVTWVAAEGPAAGVLRVGDVLHAANGRTLPTLEHWRRHLADLDEMPATLTIWRDGGAVDVVVTPAVFRADASTSASQSRPLGMTTRVIPGVGSEITALQPASKAVAAGLQIGDIVTMVGSVAAPTPAQIRRAVSSAPDRPLLVAVDRGGSHHLMTLEP